MTFFAVTNNKPAFAIETSKNITDLTEKVIYQLKSIEEFMRIMDIEFSRNFDINNYKEVQKLLFDFGKIEINNNISFNLNDIRKNLRFIPMKKSENNFKFEHSLGNSKFTNGNYEIYIGNNLITTLSPQIFDKNGSFDSVDLEIDGNIIKTKFGQILEVKKSFKVLKSPLRVNVIGFSKAGIDSEDSLVLKKSDMVSSFSLDNSNKSYRVEFYHDNIFYGMITIKFID